MISSPRASLKRNVERQMEWQRPLKERGAVLRAPKGKRANMKNYDPTQASLKRNAEKTTMPFRERLPFGDVPGRPPRFYQQFSFRVSIF